MGRPPKVKSLITQAREAGTFTRVEVPRTVCERCGTDVYALPDGSPRPHLRPTRPGEAMYSLIVPTMTECMLAEDHD